MGTVPTSYCQLRKTMRSFGLGDISAFQDSEKGHWGLQSHFLQKATLDSAKIRYLGAFQLSRVMVLIQSWS